MLDERAVGRPLTSFRDAREVADYAKEAIAVFAQTGVISGSGGKLAPRETSDRAQMAQVLNNLL